MENERRDVVLDHDYDGIQEFDNRLPNWWVGGFLVSLVFGFWYWGAYHVFAPGQDALRAAYEADLKAALDLQEAKAADVTDDAILALVRDPQAMAKGKAAFVANCVACHQADGGGSIGPNLADDHWIHGGRPAQVARLIAAGVPEKGMPTWKSVLGGSQLRSVAAYVVSLRGSRPAKPKAPQGVLEKP